MRKKFFWVQLLVALMLSTGGEMMILLSTLPFDFQSFQEPMAFWGELLAVFAGPCLLGAALTTGITLWLPFTERIRHHRKQVAKVLDRTGVNGEILALILQLTGTVVLGWQFIGMYCSGTYGTMAGFYEVGPPEWIQMYIMTVGVFGIFICENLFFDLFNRPKEKEAEQMMTQIVLVDILLIVIFAFAVFNDLIPGLHNPMSRVLGCVIASVILFYLLCKIFRAGTTTVPTEELKRYDGSTPHNGQPIIDVEAHLVEEHQFDVTVGDEEEGPDMSDPYNYPDSVTHFPQRQHWKP